MIRFFCYSNLKLKKRIEDEGYKCTLLHSNEAGLRNSAVLGVKKTGEFDRVKDFINELSNEFSIYLVLGDASAASDCEVLYLSERETEFLRHILSDNVVKKTCMEMKLSRAGYYKILHRLMTKLNAGSIDEVRAWALLHLSL